MKIFCLTLFAIIAGLSFAEVPGKQCPKACPAILRPVCAFDGEDYQIFDNECLMWADQECSDNNHKWQKKDNLMKCLARSNIKAHNDCPIACPEIYSPVCATDGKQFKFFSNQCEMKAENCLKRMSWTKSEDVMKCLHKTDAGDAQQCGGIYQPVCATDGQTYKIFTNICFMMLENEQHGKKWKVTDFFNCFSSKKIFDYDIKKCPNFCPDIFAPLCGFDGQQYKFFPNECLLKSENCKFGHGWVIERNLSKCKV